MRPHDLARIRPLSLVLVLATLTACGEAATVSSATDVPAADGATPELDALPTELGADVPGEPPPDPSEPGPTPYTILDLEVPIDGGAAAVPVIVAIPDGDGPVPVVVFTHGFALNGGMYRSWAEHLGSWGYLAILPSFPGGFVDPPTHEALADWLAELLDWTEDQGLDPASPLHGRVDTTRVGLSGHSMGGKVSLLLASRDPRVTASFTVDPVDSTSPVGDPTGYPSVTPELMAQIPIPLGFVGETLDAVPIEGSSIACAPGEDNFAQYFAHAAGPAVSLEIVGAHHMSFIDDADCGLPCLVCQASTLDHGTALALAKRSLIAFYQVTLRGEASWRAWLTGAPAQADQEAGLLIIETANGF